MNRLYYLISVGIVLAAFAGFAWRFERSIITGESKEAVTEAEQQHRRRGVRTRELVLAAVLCALTVAGRVAFFMLPQFKPMAAMIIIAAVCYGREMGFLVGTVSALVSNFFFGQGPWTPWQMLAFGLIGYAAGLCFARKTDKAGKTQKKSQQRYVQPYVVISRQRLCIFGFGAVMLIYGGIINPASLLMYAQEITWSSVLAVYVSGLPFDLIHAGATVVFLWLLAEPMQEKLLRIRKKYGVLGQY